jgi:phospholipase/carboxylesterase
MSSRLDPPGAPDPEAPLPPGAVLVAPDEPAAGDPLPLVVLLHGAGSSAQAMVDLLGPRAGALVLAPQSVGRTWDVIERGGFGPDVARLDAALAAVRGRWPVDPGATVLAGFSDGASYALSLGLANGDRFSHLVAFSPGFVAPDAWNGRPPVYVSHGREDRVLPIDRCSRRIVPSLRAAGYDVDYVEFDGGHGVPPEIAEDAFQWVRRTPAAPG